MYRCAIITGASAGLGEEFARQLAGKCETLILVARRQERLHILTAELQQKHPSLRVESVAVDLIDDSACAKVMSACEQWQLVPDLLINSAGMGDYGDFASSDETKVVQMMRLNMEALTRLSLAVLPGMMAAQKGAILQVSSLAGELPIPDFAVYAATKAYVTSFAEALRLELRESGIHVTALCPGPVHTEFGQTAVRQEKRRDSGLRELFYEEASSVVRQALLGLERNRARVYPGVKIAAVAALIGILPLVITRAVMGTRPRR